MPLGRLIFKPVCVKPWTKLTRRKDIKKKIHVQENDQKEDEEDMEIEIKGGDPTVDLGEKATNIKVKKGSNEEMELDRSRKD